MNSKEHWELIHQSGGFDQLSWFQEEPTMSIDLIRRATDLRARIIDVGGGPSSLAEALLREGYSEVTVLDVSATALSQARGRLGDRAANVNWMHADALTATFRVGAYDVWHDRAVFHFLTEATDRATYGAQMRRALRSGGHAVIATFAEDGPDQCSGLPVVRYSPEELRDELGESFDLVESARETHVTPSGSRQSFVYCLFRFVP